MALFRGNTLPHPMKNVSSTVLVGVQSQLSGGRKFMSKNDDVIVQSSQLMSATTVLYVSQADIDSVTILGSENCQ